MERIAIIENNTVSNIIKGNQSFADNYNGTAILLGDNIAGIGYAYDGTNFVAPAKTQEQLEKEGREWRDSKLKKTDFIVPTTDYPNHAAWLTYRQQLRDWTATDNFPNTKPTAPAELN